MQQQAEPSFKNATLMHAMLMAGTLVFAVVALTIGPMLENAQVVGYALAGVSVLVQLLAWMVFRPRIVPRPAATSEEEYWGDLDRFRSAMMLWTIVEGGAFIALVGWLLSGNNAGLGMAAVGVGLLVMYRPGALAGR